MEDITETEKEEPIDWEAVAAHVMHENDELRRKAAIKYFSLTPLVEEVKWRVYDTFRWVGEVDANKMAVYIMIVTAAWAMFIELVKAVRSVPPVE